MKISMNLAGFLMTGWLIREANVRMIKLKTMKFANNPAKVTKEGT